MDAGVAADDGKLLVQRVAAVGDGVQVRHARDVGEAAVRRGHGAGGDGLFIRKTRFTKMYMDINETGK